MTEPTKTPMKAGPRGAMPMPAATPFTMVDRLRRDMDRVFEGFGYGPLGQSFGRAGLELGPRTWAVSPPVDITETETDYRISAELPGLDEKDIEIKVANGTLTLKGEKKEEHEEKDKDHYLSERSYGSFTRSFEIPRGVDKEKIAATFAKGILTLVLPKSAEAKNDVRKIEVKAS